MVDKNRRGLERGQEMRKWRAHKGGLRTKPDPLRTTQLGQLVEDWSRDQRRRGLARTTIDTRRGLVRRFQAWCWARRILEPEWLSRGLLHQWLDWLDDYRTKSGSKYSETSTRWALGRGDRATCSVMPARPTCWIMVPACGRSRRFSATRASTPRKSTLTSQRNECARCTAAGIREAEGMPSCRRRDGRNTGSSRSAAGGRL